MLLGNVSSMQSAVNSSIRVALVHDWLTGFRGGEKCLEVLCRMFPNAPIYTLLHVRGSVPETIERHPIRTSFLQRFPRIGDYYRYTLPIMPFAANWPIAPCDLVFSFSHAVAKAARPPKGVPHVCYCFTPMRYAWHMKDSYFAGRVRGLKARAVDRLMAMLRNWDRRTAKRVTHFLANSETVRKRIQESYGRDAWVLYPPVDTDFYHPDPSVDREDFYLVLSAFAPYKRVDIAVEACNRLKKPLIVIGSGQDAARLNAMAGPTVNFLGWATDESIRDHLRRCRALLVPRRGGLRHRPGRGERVRHAGNHVRPGRGHGDDHSLRPGRGDRCVVPRAEGRIAHRVDRTTRTRAPATRPGGGKEAGIAVREVRTRAGVEGVSGSCSLGWHLTSLRSNCKLWPGQFASSSSTP